MIDLSLCFGDSPIHHQHILQTDRNLAHLETCLKALCKAMKHSIEATQQLAQSNMLVAEALAEVAKAERTLGMFETNRPGSNNTNHNTNQSKMLHLADVIKQIAQEFMVVELNRKQYAYELEREVNDQLDLFWRSDLSQLKELKRRWEKDGVEYAHHNTKYMSKKAKDPGLFEAAQEVADARKEYHLASLDFASRLNEVTERRVVKVYGSLSRFVEVMSVFVGKQNDAVVELKEGHQQLSEAASEKAKVIEDTLRVLAEKKRKIIIDHEPIYNPLVIDRTPTPAATPFTTDTPMSIEDELDENGEYSRQNKIKEGYLYKKSSHAMRSVWSRRYFILYNDRLEYFSMQEGNAPVPIDLRLCTVKPSSDTERRFCFDLVSPVKTFTLQAENELELEHWMEGLAVAIQEAITSSCRPSTEDPSGNTQSASIDSLLGEHRIERPMTAEEIANIRAIEGNDKCAECGESDPKWASANHGILLCIACSGVHRGLGAQVSKVRSLELDYWEPAQIDIMNNLGNTIVNAVMECLCSENYSNSSDGHQYYYKKPTPADDQCVREQWVTAKYELAKFVQPLEDHDAQQLLTQGLNENKAILVYEALQNGANPDQALLEALERDQYGNALLLLYAPADVNYAHPESGQAALHILAGKPVSNHDAHCMLLTILKRHARIDVVDRDGRSPVDVAVHHGNASAATVLRIAALADEFDEVRVSDAGTATFTHRPRRHQRLIKKLTQRII